MKKAIVILVLMLLIAGVGGVLYYVNKNTSFLGLALKEEQIVSNNTTTLDTPGVISELVTKKLLIPAKYQSGVFATDRVMNLPADFQINVYVAGLKAPRFFDFDDENNMIVADKEAGKIFMLKDVERDGVADKVLTVDSGLNNISSVYFYKGDLFSAEETAINLYRGLAPDGSYQSKEVLVPNLPAEGNHVTRTVIVGPDEKLYVSVGSSCNVCEEEDKRRAVVLRYDLDGSNEIIFAEGLRNSVGIEFNNNKLWSVENGRDLLGDDLPGEEVNILKQGEHYGWPYCYGNGITDPGFTDKKDFCEKETVFPEYSMQAHSAPLGLAFLPKGVADSNFPGSLNDNLFIGFHGSWNRTTPTGYKVVRINTKEKDAKPINFVTGWLGLDGKAWGRPVDVGFDNNNEMYISDDEAGAIYRVTFTKK